MVEVAILMPLLLLVIIGGLWLGMGEIRRMELTHLSAQAATAAASEPDPCAAAIAALMALGRAETACDGSGGLTVTVDASAVTVRLADRLPAPPILDAIWSGDVAAESGALTP